MGILPFPLPYPVASQGVSVLITGDILKHLPCVAQPIGEVARSDGGVENNITLGCLYRIFNPLALRAFPLSHLRRAEGGELRCPCEYSFHPYPQIQERI